MSATLTGGSIRILWDEDDSADVTITGGIASFTVNGSPVTFPYALTASTTFTTTHSGVYTVSVQHHGYEVANTPDGTREVTLRFGEEEIFAPSPDGTPNSTFLADLHESLSATYAPLPTAAVNPLTGWYHATGFGAAGDGSTNDKAAIEAMIAALPSTGGVLYFRKGVYLANNLRLNKSNVTILMDEGAVLKKNANGPVLSWGSGGYTGLDGQGLRIDGNGANYTGAGLVIDGGTFPRLLGTVITNTASNPIQFVGDGSGHSARVTDALLYAYDALAGGANQNVAAILLPADTTQAPNRHFVNVHAAGTLLFDDAGSQDSNFVLCTARNLNNSGTPAKQYLTSCRFASAGASVTLKGTQSMWVGCAFAGDIIVAGSSNSTLTGSVGAGNLTINSDSNGTALAGNTYTGTFSDQGTRTRISSPADGTYPPPHTIDPRSISAATALNANQAVYLRARSRGYVTKIGLHVGTSSGNICVGVYKNNASSGSAARPDTRKATSGSVACPAAGYAEVALTSAVYVDEGDWLAIVADNATATFYRGSAAAFGSNLANGVSHHQSSAFPLPSTASPGTGTLFSVLLTGVN